MMIALDAPHIKTQHPQTQLVQLMLKKFLMHHSLRKQNST